MGQFVPDDEERGFVEPRLLHLLGLEDGPTRGKEELFGAWRLFFERMAEQGPVALLFEDLQWADAALVEFIAHLLEWARQQPIFVLCLARPELQGRHPEFGHGSHQTTLSLAPLSERSMRELLDGFVPGLPEELRERILARSEGVPLYAVETVRMLLDRSLVVEQDGAYRLAGEVAELEVPETLQGLIAARLDGLAAEERRLLQDASVLGKTFTKEALAELSGVAESELDPLLAGLVRKEVLGVQADPRSPERGQYGFLQDLVRRVAYETLARRDRKSRHLAAARQLESSFGSAEQEIAEVVAAHYLAAYEAHVDADDAGEIKARARELLARAAERAASLGALGEARRSYEQAAELSDEPVERALLLEKASMNAMANAESEAAEEGLRAALELLQQAGELHAAARVSGHLGQSRVHHRARRAGAATDGGCVRGRVGGRARRRRRRPGSAPRKGVGPRRRASSVPPRRTSWRSESLRRCGFRSRWSARSERRHPRAGGRAARRGARAAAACASVRTRTRSRGTGSAAYGNLSDSCFGATATGRRSRPSARRSLSLVAAEIARASCSPSARRPTR